MRKKKKRTIKISKNRRKFLKLIAFGGVSLLAMRAFGSKALALASSASKKGSGSFKRNQPIKGTVEENNGNSISGKDINMVENDNGVVFVDRRTGEEIFILEKD